MLKAIKISDFILYINVNILLRKNQSKKEFAEIINNKIVTYSPPHLIKR